MTIPTPIADDGPAVLCQRCGAAALAGTTNCPRCGVFLPANEGNLRHGLRRYQTKGVLPADLKTDIDSFRANVISDQGGLDELPAIRAGLIRLLVDAEVGRRLNFSEVVKRGIDSAPGRAAYDRLLGTMDRWIRIAKELGLERQQRDVTLADYIPVEAQPEDAPATRTAAAWGESGSDRELADPNTTARPTAAEDSHE